MVRLQRHATVWTFAGRVLLYFRMHGTTVDLPGGCCLRFFFVQISDRARNEFVVATAAAEVVALALERSTGCSRLFFDPHAAYWISHHSFSVLALLHYGGTSITQDYAAESTFR